MGTGLFMQGHVISKWAALVHYSDRLSFPLRAPHLGRELVCKESKKNFKATIAMSQDFPLGIESWVSSSRQFKQFSLTPLWSQFTRNVDQWWITCKKKKKVYGCVGWCVGCFLRLLNVLEVIAPFKHFNKLREFVQMKLPPGFPVKLGKK